MAEVGKKLPWLKETSARSGFDNFSRFGKKLWTSVKQDGNSIAPDEYDTPPPSSRPLGGADVSGSPRANSDSTDTPTANNYSVQYITAGGGIALTDEPWLRVVGSLSTVNITRNPQITLGRPNQVIAVNCVGSSVLLEEGSGLALASSAQFLMSSGSVITMFCDRTANLWRETSRSDNTAI